MLPWYKQKTTWTALAGIVAAVGAWMSGDVSGQATVGAVIAAMSVIFLRQGVEKSGGQAGRVRIGLVVLVAVAALVLAGCQTGAARAAKVAVSGVPTEVSVSLDSIESEYRRLADQEVADIAGGKAETPEGIIRRQIAQEEFGGRKDATLDMFKALREWIGIGPYEMPNTTQEEAAARRAEVLQRLLETLNKRPATPPTSSESGGGS